MGKKQKYYVVWKGKRPGIYTSWAECKAVIDGYPQAQYKSFLDYSEAQKAYNSTYAAYKGKKKAPRTAQQSAQMQQEVNCNSIAVDAASSGNPGIMEYRGVDTCTKKELFHIGPFPEGTNNIGEFLALVHGLAFLDLHKSNRLIYSDSRTAMSWVRRQKCNTKLKRSAKTEKLFQLVDRAEKWLKTHQHSTPIVKWDTVAWGEIPADFGRK